MSTNCTWATVTTVTADAAIDSDTFTIPQGAAVSLMVLVTGGSPSGIEGTLQLVFANNNVANQFQPLYGSTPIPINLGNGGTQLVPLFANVPFAFCRLRWTQVGADDSGTLGIGFWNASAAPSPYVPPPNVGPTVSGPAFLGAPGRSPMVVDGALQVAGGQLVFVGLPGNIPSLKSYIAQLVKSRLGLFQGEYLPNAQEGMPWFQKILIKGYNPNVVRGAFYDRIAGTPGISSVKALTLNFQPTSKRGLSVAFQAQSDVGLIADQFTLPITQPPQGS